MGSADSSSEYSSTESDNDLTESTHSNGRIPQFTGSKQQAQSRDFTIEERGKSLKNVEYLTRRIVPNRYRRKEEQSDQPHVFDSKGPVSNRGRGFRSSLQFSWANFFRWRIWLFLGGYVLPHSWIFVASAAKVMLAFCVTIWNRYCRIFFLVAIIGCLSWWILGLSTLERVHSASQTVLPSKQGWMAALNPPPEHDPTAVLYF